MRIAFISNSIIPSRTANSIQVIKMCEAFSDQGHEVVLLAPEMHDKYEKNVLNVYEFYGVKRNFEIKKLWCPKIKLRVFFYTLSIFFYLFLNKRFNLVYGRFLYGCYVATLLKNDIIFETHIPNYKKKKYELKIFEKIIKSKYLKKFVVISQSLKEMFLENGYLNESIIHVAHDGADEVLDFYNKIELLGNKKNLKVGYVGHLYKGKGMEVIASIAKKIDDDIEIHIVGGLDKDICYWKKKITNKNIYFYGHVPHKEIGQYINALDICLLPNQKIVLPFGADQSSDSINISHYTSPLKLFEYMSHKKAIIASDLKVLKEVLNSKNSILINPSDINGWINAIRELKDISKREKIANHAYIDFRKYTWSFRIKNILK